MPVSAGTRIGPYEIAELIGAGGMGEVYRAVDTSLKRAVAIKVLPQAVADDSERLARLQREAEVLASLNHPNIAVIYGLERTGGVTALVMELVEGPTLAERIEQGPIEQAESVAIARQTAEALEAAHEQGVIHRDLKPANIKVRRDGTVKVLDFGLAKALAPESAAAGSVSQLPTITSPAMTQMGIVLGTAAYMSPEQASGKELDRRTDIWSFGVVLWEMLTGRRLFAGETVAHTIADVLRAPIPFDALPANTSPATQILLRRCLERNVKSRLRDIGEARVWLAESGMADAITVAVSAGTSRSRSSGVLWAASVAAAAVLGGAIAWFATPLPPADEPLHSDIGLPEGVTIPPPGGPRLALSPDGSRLVFVGISDNGRSRLWIRNMQTGGIMEIAGTEGAVGPRWSPDGRWIGFGVGGRTMRMDPDGGNVTTIAESARGQFLGVEWNAEGTTLVTLPQSATPQVFRVRSPGAAPEPVLPIDEAHQERLQLVGPFLPDGQRFLYISRRQDGDMAMVGSLDGRTRKELFRSNNFAGAPAGPLDFVQRAPGSSDGWLLYVTDRRLVARTFDASKLEVTGEPQVLAADVPNGPSFTVSSTGLLAYLQGSTNTRRLAWYGRDGREQEVVAEAPLLNLPRLSPDERRIAFSREARPQVYEMARKVTSELPVSTGRGGRSIWTPDGRDLILDTLFAGQRAVKRVRADGSDGETTLFEWASARPAGVLDVTRDGRWYLVNDQDSTVFVSRSSGAKLAFHREPIVDASLSPDGRWVVAMLQSGGRPEVFAMPAPEAAGGVPNAARVQISIDGGQQPLWRRDGREIFYVSGSLKLMAVTVEIAANELRPGTPQPLFDTRLGQRDARQYDVTADGQRILIADFLSGGMQVSLITNWSRLLD